MRFAPAHVTPYRGPSPTRPAGHNPSPSSQETPDSETCTVTNPSCLYAPRSRFTPCSHSRKSKGEPTETTRSFSSLSLGKKTAPGTRTSLTTAGLSSLPSILTFPPPLSPFHNPTTQNHP